MNDLTYILQFVSEAVWATWPVFLISILLSVLIRALKLDGMIRRAFDARVGVAILLATLVGAFSPFCSCTVVPVIAGLLMSGVPLAPIMAFWVASPTMDPEIFALSVGILGWPLALVRLGATLVLSLAAGYVTLALGRTSLLQRVLPQEAKAKEAESCCDAVPLPVRPPEFAVAAPAAGSVLPVAAGETAVGSCGTSSCAIPLPVSQPGWQAQLVASFQEIAWPEFGREMGQQSWSLGRWLLLAFVMEALIVLYVPQEAVATLLGDSNFWAVPLAALIGIPLYLNNMGALPIVAGLLAQGMQPGAAIAFLIAGPVTTIPAMTAVWGVVKRRVFALYLGVALLGAIVLGVVANLLLR